MKDYIYVPRPIESPPDKIGLYFVLIHGTVEQIDFYDGNEFGNEDTTHWLDKMPGNLY